MPLAHITTLYSVHNYGAMLQAHALQQSLLNLGITPEIIDIGGRHRQPTLLNFSTDPRGLARSIKIAPFLSARLRRYKAFDQFLQQNLRLSQPFSSFGEMQNKAITTDLLICGSDQIWNPSLPFQPQFFLRFGATDIPRVTYAPSFGTRTLPSERHDELRNLLGSFSMISCRERSGCDMLEEILGRPVEHVVDPTLLVSASYWRGLSTPVIGLPEKYLLLYSLENTKTLNVQVTHLSKSLDLPIVVIDSYDQWKCIKCERVVRDAGPKEFLWLFENASFVVTNSFHGNIFSLIFGRPFYSVPHHSKNERMASLLESLGLGIRQDYSAVRNRLDETIYTPDVAARLSVQQSRSLQFLKRAVSLIYKQPSHT